MIIFKKKNNNNNLVTVYIVSINNDHYKYHWTYSYLLYIFLSYNILYTI